MIETYPASGPPLFSATLKAMPGDFRVTEILDISLDGAGEHLYLSIEKAGTNTDHVAKWLERVCSVCAADIGFAGMKDRHAITRQWFSVRTPLTAEAIGLALSAQEKPADEATSGTEAGFRIVDSIRHGRKLRRGAHRANAFQVVLRELSAPGVDAGMLRVAVDERIASIQKSGFPNYLGPQRFGTGGQNLVRARQWFRQSKKRTSRQQRSLWLSAARSEVFNAVCAARVKADSWQQLLPGEPAVLDGSRSFFVTTDTAAEELVSRLSTFDIHPSGPWWGRGRSLASEECLAFESAELENLNDLCVGLERAGLDQERRALRAIAQDLQHEWLSDGSLALRFNLLPGVFATTLLQEFGTCSEPVRYSA